MRRLLFSTLSMETNLSSTCWGWMDHFFWASCFYGICNLSPSPLTAFPFDSQLLVGVPADPWAKWETPWVSKVQRKLDTKINTKVVTPSIIIPAKNYCVQFPCQHASFHSIFSADPKNSQRLLPKWGCFSGCSFFVWWSGFHWRKRMLGFPRKKLAIYRGVGGLQDHTLWLWYG